MREQPNLWSFSIAFALIAYGMATRFVADFSGLTASFVLVFGIGAFLLGAAGWRYGKKRAGLDLAVPFNIGLSIAVLPSIAAATTIAGTFFELSAGRAPWVGVAGLALYWVSGFIVFAAVMSVAIAVGAALAAKPETEARQALRPHLRPAFGSISLLVIVAGAVALFHHPLLGVALALAPDEVRSSQWAARERTCSKARSPAPTAKSSSCPSYR